MLPRPLGSAALRVLRPLCAAGLLLLAPGCASTASEPAPSIALPASRPGDFTLTLTVTNPAALAPTRARPRAPQSPASATPVPPAPTPAPAIPPELRPARYVIEPDGFLRAALGTGATERTYPPPIRRLTTEQLDELYTLVAAPDGLAASAGGLTPPGSSTVADPAASLSPAPPGYQFSLLADRRRAGIARALNDRAARAVAAALAKWAWQGE